MRLALPPRKAHRWPVNGSVQEDFLKQGASWSRCRTCRRRRRPMRCRGTLSRVTITDTVYGLAYLAAMTPRPAAWVQTIKIKLADGRRLRLARDTDPETIQRVSRSTL